MIGSCLRSSLGGRRLPPHCLLLQLYQRLSAPGTCQPSLHLKACTFAVPPSWDTLPPDLCKPIPSALFKGNRILSGTFLIVQEFQLKPRDEDKEVLNIHRFKRAASPHTPPPPRSTSFPCWGLLKDVRMSLSAVLHASFPIFTR